MEKTFFCLLRVVAIRTITIRNKAVWDYGVST